ncbi:MAG TPA: beta-glucosidase, partial [Firmicutes bacterium]|nr:beta-glucosidase [Bacillota bacterium]
MALSTTELVQGKKVSISLNVMNIGGRNGEEIVQVYVSALNSALYREKRVLKAFSKTFIKAWSFKTIKMSLSYDDFAIWSREKKQFIVEEGDY